MVLLKSFRTKAQLEKCMGVLNDLSAGIALEGSDHVDARWGLYKEFLHKCHFLVDL